MSINNIETAKIEEILNRGTQDVIERESLAVKLASGRQLRIKLGIDPTGAKLHIGHAVPLRKLRQFQDLGHQVILLIGDFTATIGDPSGRNETRPVLTPAQIAENEKTYITQAARILDMERVEIRHNGEWYNQPDFNHLLMELTAKVTVARVLERDDFQNRIKNGSDIQMQEIMYPLLQGYDSVALHADVEIGGTDQKFNLLMGRRIQKRYDQLEQDVITVPILEGLDGLKKMSKTYNNFIALEDTPEEMYGKIMSIPDNLILKYFELATAVTLTRIDNYAREMRAGRNPMEIKKILAEELVLLYHGEIGAQAGKEYFFQTFSNKRAPTDMPQIQPTRYDVGSVLLDAKICQSKSEVRQVIDQGGVKINAVKVPVGAYDQGVCAGDVVQKGTRFFVKII